MPVVDTSMLPAGDDVIPAVLVIWDEDDLVLEERILREIVPELSRRLPGWKVFTELDAEMMPQAGANFDVNAHRQARRAKKLIIFATPRLVQTTWWMYQVQAFMITWGPMAHAILPVIIEPCALPSMLAMGQALDCTREIDWQGIVRFVTES